MRVLSAAEMQACDRVTSERYGVSSLELMRNAAGAIAMFAREQFPHAARVMVLCGRGNNGGDGSMAARLLAEAGLNVTVVLLGNPAELNGDAAAAWSELQDAGSCAVHAVESKEQFEQVSRTAAPDLIVDAVVGTGFKPPVRGLALDGLQWVRTQKVPVLAVDLPSGWFADSTASQACEPVFPADAVVTFSAPKPAHVFGELTRRWDQPVVVTQIGSPPQAVVSELGMEWTGGAAELYHAPREADSNKGLYGHVLVVGGTFGSAGGKAGAPAMSSIAALRSGAGLVTAAVPAPALAIVAGYAPELMTVPLMADVDGAIGAENLEPDRLKALIKGITVLAIGPGMGQAEGTARFFFALLETTSMPVVIDADGLNLLSEDIEKLGKLTAGGRTVVLTPHPGEMGRLAGLTTAQVQAGRLGVARRFAQQHRVHLVLKGSRTIVAHPDGRVAVNTTGNPAMAKGGSGDLLTGIVAGMLAQHPDQAAAAVEAAVYLHGLAADLTVRKMDEHTMLATDTLRYLSRAFAFQSRTANNYVWLQGLPDVRSSKGSR